MFTVEVTGAGGMGCGQGGDWMRGALFTTGNTTSHATLRQTEELWLNWEC